MKQLGFFELYGLTFLCITAGYAYLAGWSTLLYRKKAWGQLSPNELKVKQGTATRENRFDLFFRSLATGVFTWQLHLAALVVGGTLFGVFQYIL